MAARGASGGRGCLEPDPGDAIPEEIQVVPLRFDVPGDRDGDGVAPTLDADDADPRVGERPPACLAGIGDCPVDDDGDGVPRKRDCVDADPAIGPFLPEERCNGLDENCDGLDDCDSDMDGALDRDDAAPDDPAIGVMLDENDGAR